jgi:hypothetical protein
MARFCRDTCPHSKTIAVSASISCTAVILQAVAVDAESSRPCRYRFPFRYQALTRKALEGWLYRTFLKHPAKNCFSEADFVEGLTHQHFNLTGAPCHTFFGDIVIGAARRTWP